MALLLLCLVLLVGLGNFADFIIGQSGGRRVKDRLVDFYVIVGESDWFYLFRYVSKWLSDFIDYTFGRRILSIRYFSSVLTLSALMSMLVLVGALGVASSSFVTAVLDVFDRESLIPILAIIAGNYIADIISWTSTRLILGKISEASGRKIFAYAIASVAIDYIAVSATIYLCARVLMFYYTEADTEVQGRFELRMAWQTFVDPWNAPFRLNRTDLWVFAVSVLMPQLIFLATIVVCFLLYVARPIIQAPLSVLLQRLEESSKGVFTSIAGGMTVLISIIAALQKALE